MRQIDISSYTFNHKVIPLKDVYIVVKSLDQPIRRKKLIASLNRQTNIGRLEPRPVSKGLLVRTTLLSDGQLNLAHTCFCMTLREPRSIKQIGGNRYLLAEVNRVIQIDSSGNIIHEYHHPFFSYLHSLDIFPEKKTFAVVSSGYDALFEFNYETGEISWEWFGWEHGFNPRPDGVYLCVTMEKVQELVTQGKPCKYIDPAEYGEQGLFTATRIMHPNSLCYKDGNTLLVTLGHSGHLLEIDKLTNAYRSQMSVGDQMPHGISPYEDGWMITNTLRGELWILDDAYEIKTKYILRNIPGKLVEAGEREWLQTVCALDNETFIGIDANRGLILFNILKEEYCIVGVDPDWCVQEIMVLDSSPVLSC